MPPIYFLLLCWRFLATLFIPLASGHFRKSDKRKSLMSATPSSFLPYKNRRKPAWVVHKIIRLKAFDPQASCRGIEQTFNRIYSVKRNMTVSHSFVHGIFQKHAYEVLDLRRRFKRRIPRAIPVNDIWAIDLTGKGDVFGYIHSILGIIDHGSRKLVSLEVISRKNSWTLLGYLFIAIGSHGKPKKLRSDNDAVFKSRLFRTVLALVGIRQQFSDPGCPWMNGRIERLFGTLKGKLNRFKIDGHEMLSTMLSEFGFWYNAVRPHQHLNGCTPDEVWYGINPYADSPKSVQFFSAWEGVLQGYYLRY